MKCEYCGKKIGLLAVRYTWLDKANKRAMHDACYEKYQKEKTEKIEVPTEEQPLQKEETALPEKMVKSKIIGALLLLITAFFILSYFYARFITRSPISFEYGILHSIFYAVSLLIGIELVTVKKQGTYNKFLLISGIILIIIYLIWFITIVFAISLW